MKLVCKHFDELSNEELYKILKARQDVFVVEQECPYHDIDGADMDALHVFIEDKNNVLAYLRAIRKDTDTIQMGRVLTLQRGEGLGKEILKAGIQQIIRNYDPQRIYIEAQSYATGFYEQEGFVICSEEFLEDNIPHVGMELILKK